MSDRKPLEWDSWERVPTAPGWQRPSTVKVITARKRKAPSKPKAALSSRVPAAVARFVVRYGTQTEEPPDGVSAPEYREYLAQLVKQGVLKVWEWGKEFGLHLQPELPKLAGLYLYLAGPKWATFKATVER